MLNPKQEKFVLEYLKDLNATQAAIRAGYATRGASVQGTRLLANPKIASCVAKKQSKVIQKLEITAERILLERARLAFFDPRKLLDNTGRPRPLHELDDDTAAAIAGIKVVNVGNEIVGEGEILDIKLADKNASLTALEKIQGMYSSGDEPAGVLNIHVHF